LFQAVTYEKITRPNHDELEIRHPEWNRLTSDEHKPSVASEGWQVFHSPPATLNQFVRQGVNQAVPGQSKKSMKHEPTKNKTKGKT
jgi:hypothetical protein